MFYVCVVVWAVFKIFFFAVWVNIGLVPGDASDMILWAEDRLLLWKCCSSAYILKSCQIISLFCPVQVIKKITYIQFCLKDRGTIKQLDVISTRNYTGNAYVVVLFDY